MRIQPQWVTEVNVGRRIYFGGLFMTGPLTISNLHTVQCIYQGTARYNTVRYTSYVCNKSLASPFSVGGQHFVSSFVLTISGCTCCNSTRLSIWRVFQNNKYSIMSSKKSMRRSDLSRTRTFCSWLDGSEGS